jgi:phage terminase small subunit
MGTETRPVCYLVDPNATQATIRAGDSIRTTQEQSARLLSNVMVSEQLQSGSKHWQRNNAACFIVMKRSSILHASIADHAPSKSRES